jgi:hypothetical protein
VKRKYPVVTVGSLIRIKKGEFDPFEHEWSRYGIDDNGDPSEKTSLHGYFLRDPKTYSQYLQYDEKGDVSWIPAQVAIGDLCIVLERPRKNRSGKDFVYISPVKEPSKMGMIKLDLIENT